MHYYQHHIGDFVRDTANLNDHQCMTYLRLMWLYYDTEEPITGECDRIAFAVRSDASTVRLILEHYFTFSEGAWHHNRIEAELNRIYSKSEKARKSANARWANENAMRTHSERNANESKNDATHEPINPITNTGEERGSPPIAACPQKEILALWAEKLPTAIQPREWTPTRSTALKTRWRENVKRQSLDWWARFFDYIGQSDFLMGRTASPGRKAFELSLDWLLKQENFVKTMEGRYHSKDEVTA